MNAAHPADAGAAESAHGKDVSLRTIVLVFVALLCATALTLGLSYAPLGAWEIPAALTIAFVKACLVALYFMRLVEQPPANRLVLAIAFVLAVSLVVFVAADVGTRGTPPAVPMRVTYPQ